MRYVVCVATLCCLQACNVFFWQAKDAPVNIPGEAAYLDESLLKSVSIDGSQSTATRDSLVNLRLTGRIPNADAQMIVSSDPNCSNDGPWEPYAPVKLAYALTNFNSDNFIYAKVREPGQHESKCVPVVIRHDTVQPSLFYETPIPSPGLSTFVYVHGGVDADASVVKIYKNTSCNGTPATTVPKSDFTDVKGVRLDVDPETSTDFTAIAIDEAGNVSACTSFGSYTHTYGPFGNGHDGDATFNTIITDSSVATLPGTSKLVWSTRRVFTVVNPSQGIYEFSVQNYTPNEFANGDEILWMVMAERSTADCGGARVGTYGYLRLRDLSSNGILHGQAEGSNTPPLANASSLNSTPIPGQNFCFMQVVRVAEFNTLTLGSGLTSAHTFETSAGGGVLPIKAKHLKITSAHTFNVAFRGYLGGQGGVAMSYSGWSPSGQGDATAFPGSMGGGASISSGDQGGQLPIADVGGGGGAGASSGGGAGQSMGESNSGGLVYKCAPPENCLLMGGGGGGPTGSGATGLSGGRGAGILILHAATVESVGAAGLLKVLADGATGPSIAVPGGHGGGGGGGGSVFVKMKTLVKAEPSSPLFDFSYGGGLGGDKLNPNTLGGGGGGAGLLTLESCEFLSTNLDYVDRGAGGAGGIGTNGTGVMGGSSLATIDTSQDFCRWGP